MPGTFNNAINWSDLGEPIKPTMSELAKSLGRATGVVTSVEWSHATPAGFSNAHVPERDQYKDIAQQMLSGGVLDVIMGAGNLPTLATMARGALNVLSQNPSGWMLSLSAKTRCADPMSTRRESPRCCKLRSGATSSQPHVSLPFLLLIANCVSTLTAFVSRVAVSP